MKFNSLKYKEDLVEKKKKFKTRQKKHAREYHFFAKKLEKRGGYKKFSISSKIAKSGGGTALAVVSPRQCILYGQAGVAQPLL